MSELPRPRQPERPAFVAPAGIAALTPDLGRLFIVVGVFDGLHRGHAYLLRRLQTVARRHAARPAVITFDAHPREIIAGAAPPQLCDPEERLVMLAAAGVEVAVVQHFDRALRETSYQAFVDMIRERVELGGFLMTPDAAFGYERQGTPDTLRELGAAAGFEVEVVEPLLLAGRPISSSEIRSAVAEGDLGRVRHLLGRGLAVVGERAGPGNGRMPSIRLTFPLPVALPPEGRYAVAIGEPWSLGRTPEPATNPAITIVSDGPELELRSEDPLPPTNRLRVVFGRRLGRRGRGPAAASVAGSRQS